MPGVCRKGDLLATGHGCAPVTVLNFPSQNTVQADFILVARQGDPTIVHTIGGSTCVPHVAFVNKGSATVLVEFSPVARIGDSADLGAMTTGSSTIIVGG
jgi:uncharacterized Zn-binding protein involved in type VI secretion